MPVKRFQFVKSICTMNSLKVYKILKKKSFEELNAIGCFKGQEQKMSKNLLKFFYIHIDVNFTNIHSIL